MFRFENLEVEALREGQDVLEEDLDLALVRCGKAKLFKISFNFFRFVDDVPSPKITNELVAEEVDPELD